VREDTFPNIKKFQAQIGLKNVNGVIKDLDNNIIDLTPNINNISNIVKNDLTLLADYPARKYSGDINLSESIQNFNFLVVVSSFSDNSNRPKEFIYIPTELLIIDENYCFFDMYDTYYTEWIYKSTNLFTFKREDHSWIRSIFGMGRK